MSGSQAVSMAFCSASAGVKGCCLKTPAVSYRWDTTSTTMTENREPGLAPAAKAIEGLEKKLRTGIQKQVLVGQNLARHQAVLGVFKDPNTSIMARRRNP